MAMTKKEQAEFEAMREARDLARALRWPAYSTPEMVPPPQGFDSSGSDYISGWHMNPYLMIRYTNLDDAVRPAWSRASSHSVGEPVPFKGHSASQRGIPLFASRKDALMALRLEVTENFARRLLQIDQEIAKEEGVE